MNDRPMFSLALCVTLCVFALAALLVLVGDTARAQSSTRYVATTGTDSGDCTDANNPCHTVQYAVDAATDEDLIKVAAGSYTGVQGRAAPPGYPSPPPTGIITQVVYISKTVAIRGGYTNPGFADPPDPEANPTTLDAEDQGRVLLIGGNISPTIEGLRITGGDAAGLGGVSFGWDLGGGAYVIGATAIIVNNQVLSNTCSSPLSLGGGMSLMLSNSTVSGNTFSHNTSGFGGGGLYLAWNNPIIDGNLFTFNSAQQGGGAFLTGPGAAFIGNILTSNTAEIGGGLVSEGGTQWFINNFIADNNASSAGGGLWSNGSSPRLYHNTIARNSGGDGSGVYVTQSDFSGLRSAVFLTNTILVSHTVGITVALGNTATLESTLWHGNTTDWDGAGTINRSNDHTGNPAFVDPNAGDYHIDPGSAALDQGVDAGVMRDIDNEPRLGVPDLGADEYWAPGALKLIYLPLVLRNAP